MKAPVQSRSSSLDLQLTTLIDVVFLLLIFFVWTSSFEKPEYDLASEMTMPAATQSPSITATPPPLFDEIEISLGPTLGNTAAIELNGKLMADLAQLQSELVAIIKLGAQPAIVIQPDARTQMNHAIEVYDLARIAGFDQVLFAVSP